jgi:AmmeMemoRadiSam system protein B
MRESHRPYGSPPGFRSRPPAVAGRFYPGESGALTTLVDRLLDSVHPGNEPRSPGYVVPHAGYVYSGQTAAHAYARLRGRPAASVILIGPAHYIQVRGCVVPTAESWLTPLGEVPVDVDAVHALARDGHVTPDDAPFAPEHSLEVQLPFLQRCWPEGWRLLPMAIGRSTVDDVVVTLSAALEATGPDTLLLCSTDLSHYQAEAAANAQDARTTRAVLDLAPDRVGPRDACGAFALRGIVGWARHVGLRPTLLHRCTSADTAGDADRVVGYGAFVFS